MCLASLALAHRRAVSLLRGMLYPPSNSEGSDSLYLYAATILATSVSRLLPLLAFFSGCVWLSHPSQGAYSQGAYNTSARRQTKPVYLVYIAPPTVSRQVHKNLKSMSFNTCVSNAQQLFCQG